MTRYELVVVIYAPSKAVGTRDSGCTELERVLEQHRLASLDSARLAYLGTVLSHVSRLEGGYRVNLELLQDKSREDDQGILYRIDKEEEEDCIGYGTERSGDEEEDCVHYITMYDGCITVGNQQVQFEELSISVNTLLD